MKNNVSQEELMLMCQLRSKGIPLDEEVLEAMQDASRRPHIYQTGTVVENTIFDLHSGGTGYMLSIAIHNDSNRIVSPHEYRLEMLWFEPEFRWLEDPWRKEPREYAYSFPKPRWAPFEREVVLNHRLGRNGRINPDGWLEGLLLGVGREPIPEKYHARQRLQTRLLVFDGRGNRFETDLNLLVDRSVQLNRHHREEKLTRRYRNGKEVMVP